MHIICEEVANRGVKTWLNMAFAFDGPLYVSDDVACIKKGGTFNGRSVRWNAYDFDPKYLGDFTGTDESKLSGVFGLHWTNFLRYNPENNFERIPAWIDYFKRQAEIFGFMLSRNTEFCANQAFFARSSKIREKNGCIVIDVSSVKKSAPSWIGDTFYVSFKKERLPSSCDGGKIELYEEHAEFNTYKITLENNKEITFYRQ